MRAGLELDFFGTLDELEAYERSRVREVLRLKRINTALLKALKEIAKGEGAFSTDQLTFANNAIENMKEIACDAIAEAKETNG